MAIERKCQKVILDFLALFLKFIIHTAFWLCICQPKKTQAESEEGGDGAPQTQQKRERETDTQRDTEERDRNGSEGREGGREGGKGGRGWSFFFHLFANVLWS
jgi:hypothetical protein